MRARSRSIVGVLTAVGLALVLATPALACKCAPVSIGALDPSQNQVYVGAAGSATADGTPMTVERWFSGPGEASTVMLGASSFGDSASCGIEPLPVGSRWIMSAYVSEAGAAPVTGQCQPHAVLGSIEGDTMLAEAEAAYGPGTMPSGGQAAQSEDDDATTRPLAVLGIAIIGVLLVAVALAIRRDHTAEA